MKPKEPLYRKVNTTAHGVYHHKGSDAKSDRNTKGGLKKSLKQGVQRGLDYTPLYRFLLSKVGQDWDAVYSEAISRLDQEDPIFYMVDRELVHERNRFNPRGYFTTSESSRWSTLIIDENKLLQLKNPALKNEDLYPSCDCCTHTFNGTPLQKTYSDFNHLMSTKIIS